MTMTTRRRHDCSSRPSSWFTALLLIVLCSTSVAFPSGHSRLQRTTTSRGVWSATTSKSCVCSFKEQAWRGSITWASASCKKIRALRVDTVEKEDIASDADDLDNERNKVIILESINNATTTPTTIASSTDESVIEDLSSETLGLSKSNINDNALLIMAVLCWTVACLSALDRVAMSVAMLPLSQEFGYTETIKGQISSLFSVGYGLCVLPSGLYMSSKSASPKWVLGGGIALWSLATLATPVLATSSATLVLPLLLARALVGAAEAVVLPSLQKIMSNWIPPQYKSLAVAGIFSGFQAGTVAAYITSPIVMEYVHGWRGLFYVYGGIGLVLLLPWMLLAKDEPQHLQAAVQEQALVENSSESAIPSLTTTQQMYRQEDEASLQSDWQQEALEMLKSAPWKEFISSKGFWAMMLAHAANNWGLYNNLAWTPTFYAEQYGLNVADSAWLSVLPSVTGAVGGLAAGALADLCIQRLEHDGVYNEQVRSKVRKTFQGIALYGPALMLGILSHDIPQQPWMAQALLMGTVGLQAFNAAGYGAANQEKAGPKWSGLLYSVSSLPGVAVGSLGVYATGQILDATQGDWSNVFVVNALVNVIGATAFVALYNSKQEWD